jgi:hypothetical protein
MGIEIILNPCSWIDDHPQISFGIVKVLGISVPKLLGQPPGMDTSMQFNTDAQREILNLELLLVGASVSEWYSKCTIHSWVSWRNSAGRAINLIISHRWNSKLPIFCFQDHIYIIFINIYFLNLLL